jgi:enterochelin esterase-like enzyme
MFDGLVHDVLAIQILNPQVIAAFYAAGVLAVLLVLLRRPGRRWLIAAGIGLAAGASAGALVLVLTQLVLDTFGAPLSRATNVWVVVAFAAVGLAVASMIGARWWRRVVAIVTIPVVLAAAGVGINADYALAETIGEILGETSLQPIELPAKTADAPSLADWTPSADAPSTGVVGRVDIPNTVSGFPARDASIYLPPAALVADPPALPVVIMMMGQPGTTDPTVIAKALDGIARDAGGVAPIAIVVDQLSRSDVDPLCTDITRYGAARTYVTEDVVAWARSALNIVSDRTGWTIAGFSNGGTCATVFGAAFPETFGNVVDVAGEGFPGQQNEAAVLRDVFGGDQDAYDAIKPATILAGTAYADTRGYFTDASSDAPFAAETEDLANAAAAAGWDASYVAIDTEGHGGAMLQAGLDAAFRALAPRLGIGLGS